MINQQDNTPAGFKEGLTEFVAIDGEVFFFQDKKWLISDSSQLTSYP